MGADCLVSVVIAVVVEKVGAGVKTCCRRTLLMTAVEGGAWAHRHV